MLYKLKPTEPPFEVVDGPCAGRKYNRKGIYAEIPPQYAERFEDAGAETRISENAETKKAASTHPRVNASTQPEVTHE